MSNLHSFSIRTGVALPVTEKCPLCGDDFEMNGMDIYDGNDVPICKLCGWENATALADLLSLSHAVFQHYNGTAPPDVCKALEKRRSDPKRLKRELQNDYDSIGTNGPLGEFLKEQLKAALDGKNVEKLKAAKLLFEKTKRGISTVTDLDDEIPF